MGAGQWTEYLSLEVPRASVGCRNILASDMYLLAQRSRTDDDRGELGTSL